MSTSIAAHSSTNGILIASANADLRRRVIGRLPGQEWSVLEAQGGADALGKLESAPCRLLLVDLLPDLNMDEFIGIVERRYPGTDVILIDPSTGEPLIPEELRDDAIYQALAPCGLPEAAPMPMPLPVAMELPEAAFDALPDMVGKSAAMRRLTRLVRLVAKKDSTVLITGETGTGKELIAAALHNLSPRRLAPFATVNCAAIPDTLLEAELFGYARGAFTGAVQSRIGKIQAAHGGTLFLDEIGEMPPAIQAKLLRFLQNGELQRLGSSENVRVDVRIVAATNAHLLKMVARRDFREDLYYRLAVFPIEIPALRSREGDVAMLARHFLSAATGGRARLMPETERMLQLHHWPGNVRELQHVIERATILADGDLLISPEHIVLMSPAGSN
jgi:DNA-binding NtrC family response regulator